MLIMFILLLLSPFEGALNTLRSNEKEKENEKENEKKNILSGKPDVVRYFFVNESRIDYGDKSTCQIQLASIVQCFGFDVFTSLRSSLLASLSRKERPLLSATLNKQIVAIKHRYFTAPDQPLKASLTYGLVRSRKIAFKCIST
jgi:hypothetical protein